MNLQDRKPTKEAAKKEKSNNSTVTVATWLTA